MPPAGRTNKDDELELEFDLERLINDTLTGGVAGESPAMAPHPPPAGPPPSMPDAASSGNTPGESPTQTQQALAELVAAQNGDMSVRINNYERLFACAEHLASAKKQVDELIKEQEERQLNLAPGSADWSAGQGKIAQLKGTIGRICMQMAEEIGITVPPMDPIHAEETLVPLIYRCIPRDHAGQLLSIGSIPHFCGEACVGPCRFHRKGKCFDGPLCRFCHLDGPHPGAVKKVPKKSRKAKKSPKKDGMPDGVPSSSTNALAALFAALDVSTDDPRNEAGYLQTMNPYGMDPYAAQQFGNDLLGPQFNRDAAPAFPPYAAAGGFQAPWQNPQMIY
jgi:hypothetical protein